MEFPPVGAQSQSSHAAGSGALSPPAVVAAGRGQSAPMTPEQQELYEQQKQLAIQMQGQLQTMMEQLQQHLHRVSSQSVDAP